MADTEFEEFHCNNYFEKLSVRQHSLTHPYTLVHDVHIDDDSPEGPEDEADGGGRKRSESVSRNVGSSAGAVTSRRPVAVSSSDEDLPASNVFCSGASECCRDNKTDKRDQFANSHSHSHPQPGRKRRKLPQIPNQKRSFLSLADELCETLYPQFSVGEAVPMNTATTTVTYPRSFLMMKCLDGQEGDYSPTEHDHDSGISTVHSPDGPKSSSPLSNNLQAFSMALILHLPTAKPCKSSRSETHNNNSITPASTCASSIGLPFTQLELLEATHRALHKFVPRHHDEMEIEIGDPIYVQKEAEDLWCEGVNLRTGQQGIFPSAYAVDLEYEEFDSGAPKAKRERFLIGYLGSLETVCHKGNAVLNQAVKKMSSTEHKPQSCILEVSDQGLRMNDKTKPSKSKSPCHDYFYALKNVTFCAFHPEDHRYMCFITKHPQLQRFACHLFLAHESTRPVVESVGRALQRFYEKFIETAYPVEEIYIEDDF